MYVSKKLNGNPSSSLSRLQSEPKGQNDRQTIIAIFTANKLLVAN